MKTVTLRAPDKNPENMRLKETFSLSCFFYREYEYFSIVTINGDAGGIFSEFSVKPAHDETLPVGMGFQNSNPII